MTTWTYGNTTLTTYGKVTLINDYLSSPARRGNNMVIPFRHGNIFVKKFYDERIMTFGIAVTAASLTALEAVFDAMRAKFAPLTEQVLQATMTDATVREANAIVNGAIQVEPITSTFAKVVVEFSLARPFFRSNTAIASTIATIDADNHDLVVDNTGTIEERDPTIILTGPLNDVVITNTTNGLTLTWTGDLADAGHHVDISTNSTGEYIALLDNSTNEIGNVTHTGDTALMVFNVGVNHLHIHSDVTTTGTVEVTFKPPYA
jgi:hypothetical protein